MTRTFLNVVFIKDEAFQRRKFYLGQKVEKIQFQFTTFVHHLLKDQKADKFQRKISSFTQKRRKFRSTKSDNEVFERSSQSPHLIQKNMFECDSHV